MHPRDFLKTIYLGDRGCKKIIIDGWQGRVLMQVNLISRIRSVTLEDPRDPGVIIRQ